MRKTTILFLVLSVLLIAAGVCCEETAIVLSKAIHICLECVGIG